MGFCYPGTGKGGDLTPRSECAEAWHGRLLASTPELTMTLLIGQYALRAYLPDRTYTSVTEAVRGWQETFPHSVALPHPSPRNNRWLAANPWFEDEVVPALRGETARLIGGSSHDRT
jgi:uracil-DNA glycosylase